MHFLTKGRERKKLLGNKQQEGKQLNHAQEGGEKNLAASTSADVGHQCWLAYEKKSLKFVEAKKKTSSDDFGGRGRSKPWTCLSIIQKPTNSCHIAEQ